MSEEPTQQVETQAEPTPAAPAAPAPEVETIKGEPFDAARAMKTIEQLRAEIKELKPKAKLAEELSAAEEKRKEAEMTELEKLQRSLEKAQAELKSHEIAALRRQAADEAKLPLVFADRLRGDTLEELKADAERLLEALPAPKLPPVSPTSPGAGASQGETLEQRRAALYGSGGNVMSPEFAKRHGGGVVMKEKPLTPPG